MKTEPPRLLNNRHFAGETWGVEYESHSRNKTASFLNGESIRALAREFKHSRNTICKHLATIEEPVYHREHQPLPALGEYVGQLTSWLEHDIKLPRKQRRTAQRLY